MIDLDRLKLRAMLVLCLILAIGWGLTAYHAHALVSVTETAQSGWGECVNHALVKLDALEERRRENVGALLFGGREIEP